MSLIYLELYIIENSLDSSSKLITPLDIYLPPFYVKRINGSSQLNSESYAETAYEIYDANTHQPKDTIPETIILGMGDRSFKIQGSFGTTYEEVNGRSKDISYVTLSSIPSYVGYIVGVNMELSSFSIPIIINSPLFTSLWRLKSFTWDIDGKKPFVQSFDLELGYVWNDSNESMIQEG